MSESKSQGSPYPRSPNRIGLVMGGQAQIGIDSMKTSLVRKGMQSLQFPVNPRHRLVGDIASERFQIGAEKLNARISGPYAHFVSVQAQSEFLFQVPLRNRNQTAQPGRRSTDHIEIINISPIVLHSRSGKHEVVEPIQVHIAEQLGSKVADRKATSFRRTEKALVIWERVPIRFGANPPAMLDRIVQYDLLQQVLNERIVQPGTEGLKG